MKELTELLIRPVCLLRLWAALPGAHVICTSFLGRDACIHQTLVNSGDIESYLGVPSEPSLWPVLKMPRRLKACLLEELTVCNAILSHGCHCALSRGHQSRKGAGCPANVCLCSSLAEKAPGRCQGLHQALEGNTNDSAMNSATALLHAAG